MFTKKKKEYTIKEDELVSIEPVAFIDLLCHAWRFNALDKPLNENESVYGFLKGEIKDKHRIIKEVETILHHPTPDFEFNDEFLRDMDDFNARYTEEQSLDRIIGWYKSTVQEVSFKAIDVKNQLKYQSINDKYIGMVINPLTFLKGEGYGFSIFSLMEDSVGEINIMSGAAKIPWEIAPLGDDPESTVRHIKDLIDKSINKVKFVTELSEAWE